MDFKILLVTGTAKTLIFLEYVYKIAKVLIYIIVK